MRPELGKEYVSRCGDKVLVVYTGLKGKFPILCVAFRSNPKWDFDESFYYAVSEDGKYSNLNAPESPGDIVGLWKE